MGGRIQTTFKGTPSYYAFLRWLKGRDQKKLGHETWCRHRQDGSIVIRHYHTDIITYYEGGEIKLYNGGWFTPTTQVRLEQFTPFYLYTKNGCLFVSWEGVAIPYTDHMILSDSGQETLRRWFMLRIEEQLQVLNEALDLRYKSSVGEISEAKILLEFYKHFLAEHEGESYVSELRYSHKTIRKIYRFDIWDSLKSIYGKTQLKEMLYECFAEGDS